MNISLDYYKIFYVVAKSGNITKAANELNISQPAISKCIKLLEQQLGGQLFVRTKRGVNLTEEGKEFYKYIEQAMEFINNAEHKFSEMVNLDTGLIKIGISTTLTKKYLMPFIELFHELYPKIRIQIQTAVSTRLFELLRQGLVDLVIVNLPVDKVNDIEIIKVKEVQDCFIVGDAYKDLTKSPYIFTEMIGDKPVHFYFSSNLHLNNFTKKREQNYQMLYNHLYKRFKYKVNCRMLADCNLYQKIENRGFYIKYNNKEFLCRDNLTLNGESKMSESWLRWQETLIVN